MWQRRCGAGCAGEVTADMVETRPPRTAENQWRGPGVRDGALVRQYMRVRLACIPYEGVSCLGP